MIEQQLNPDALSTTIASYVNSRLPDIKELYHETNNTLTQLKGLDDSITEQVEDALSEIKRDLDPQELASAISSILEKKLPDLDDISEIIEEKVLSWDDVDQIVENNVLDRSDVYNAIENYWNDNEDNLKDTLRTIIREEISDDDDDTSDLAEEIVEKIQNDYNIQWMVKNACEEALQNYNDD